MSPAARRPPPFGPGGRPFRGLRPVALFLSVAAVAANAAILLSDRAPGVLYRLSVRVDAGVNRAAGAAGVDIPGGSVHVPRSDFDVHVLIWGIAALVVGLASWSWFTLLFGSSAVFASSVAIELAQAGYSSTRRVQFVDAVANAVGVAIGTCVVVAFVLLWWVVSALVPRRA